MIRKQKQKTGLLLPTLLGNCPLMADPWGPHSNSMPCPLQQRRMKSIGHGETRESPAASQGQICLSDRISITICALLKVVNLIKHCFCTRSIETIVIQHATEYFISP